MVADTAFTTPSTFDARRHVAIEEIVSNTKANEAASAAASVAIQTAVGIIQQDTTAIKQDTAALRQDTAAIKQDTGAIKQAIEVTIPAKLDTLQTGVTAILEQATTAIPQQLAAIQALMRDEFRAGLLNRETTAKTGTTTTIRYRTASGLTPTVDVYDANNVRQVAAATMTEIGNTGVYEYDLTLDPNWGLGDLSIIASESTKGTLHSMTLTAAVTDIPTIGTDIAQIKADIGSIPASFSDIQTKLDTVDTNLIQTVEATKTDLAEVGSVVDDIRARWGTLTAEEIAASVTSEMELVLGTPTDTAADSTVFGKLADLDSLGAQLESVEAAASGAQGLASRAASSASAARAIIEQVRNELGAEGKTESAYELLGQLRTSLMEVNKDVTAIPQNLNLEPMQNSIREISELMKQVSSDNGINLDVMYESIDETTTDVSELKDKVERLKALLNLNREIMEKLLKKSPPKEPVIKTWFETG
jgi:hypothetical protein